MFIEELARRIDSVVKRDDIRGIAGDTITGELAFNLGRAFARLIRSRTAVRPVNIAVGHDARRSGPMLSLAFCSGVTEEGCRPILMGLAGTEVVGFMAAKYAEIIDGGVIITASHNPREYNGFKFFGRQGQPLDLAGKLAVPDPEKELTHLALSMKKAAIPLRLPWRRFAPDYARTILERSGADFRSAARGLRKPLKVAVEAGNGVGGVIAREIAALCPHFEWTFSHDNPDGSFPVTVPNPLTHSYQELVRTLVAERKPDVVLCFDGDADRAAVFDEKGEMVAPSIITTLVGTLLRKRLGADVKIAHNLPSSWCVADTLGDRDKVLGDGPTVMTPVGYGKIKPLMFEMPEIAMGAEHSGHYMFREFWRADSGMMCAVLMLEIAAQARGEGRRLSRLCAPFLKKYFPSRENNFQLAPSESAQGYIAQAVAEMGKGAKHIYVVSDGRCRDVNGYPPEGVAMDVSDVRVEFEDWWFCMRASGTEKEKGEILRCYVESVGKGVRAEHALKRIAKMVGPEKRLEA
jgi:phosphomannomutase